MIDSMSKNRLAPLRSLAEAARFPSSTAPLLFHFAGRAAGRPPGPWGGSAIGVVAGLLFSVVRLMQSAHLASATLWSATVDRTVGASWFLPLPCPLATPPR
jgi:membrane-associated PAP2 superfamily phosphatase